MTITDFINDRIRDDPQFRLVRKEVDAHDSGTCFQGFFICGFVLVTQASPITFEVALEIVRWDAIVPNQGIQRAGSGDQRTGMEQICRIQGW